MQTDAGKNEHTLQVVEALARQLVASSAQRRVAGDFLSQLAGDGLSLVQSSFDEKENVVPSIQQKARSAQPLRELSPFSENQPGRGVEKTFNAPQKIAVDIDPMSSIDSDLSLRRDLKLDLIKLKEKLEDVTKAEEVMSHQLQVMKTPVKSKKSLQLKEALKKEETLLKELRDKEQDQSRTKHPKTLAMLATEESLRRHSQDLATDLEKKRLLQQDLESQMKNMESHCSRLSGRLQLVRQRANKLRSGKESIKEDVSVVCEQEVIQLLNAAMSCLDGSTVETLTSFRSSLRSVVELFRRDLLMLVDELRSHGAEIEGSSSCRSMVFSVCDALSSITSQRVAVPNQRKDTAAMEIPQCSPVSVGRDKRIGQVMPGHKGGETGTLQSTQRLVLLLQQQEEELSNCLARLKPLQPQPRPVEREPNVRPSPKKMPSSPAYPESLTSTPAEFKKASSPGSPGLKQIAANAQRLQQLLEIRGGTDGVTHQSQTPEQSEQRVRTEDVPLRALWKEFQECEALVAENVAAANATVAPVMPRVRQAKIAKSERLPCMVQLEEQEKNLVQLNQLLHQQLPQTPPGLIREADKSEMSEMPHITPPMLGTPSKSSPESQDAGTPSSCLRRARSRLSQLREGLT